MSQSLVALLWSYLDEALELDRDDPRREWSSNTVWYGVPPGPIDRAEVCAALREVARQLRVRFRNAGSPVTFYAWYDEQAGQLRCSFASVDRNNLPFGGSYRAVDGPEPVIDLLVANPHPGLLRWDELRPTEDSTTADPPMPPFPVFAVSIGSAADGV
jgi:hypothetical protein